MKPGRNHFYSGLRSLCDGLLATVVRYQLSHEQYLERRTLDILQSKSWKLATSTARAETLAYLHGGISMLYTTKAVVWKHRDKITKEWLDSPLPPGVSYDSIDPNESRHVWANTNAIF